MSNFNTIHIFGFGDSQIIGKDSNGTVKSDTLTTLEALVDHIKTFKPEGVVSSEYHAIHIFNGMTIRYLGQPAADDREETSFIINLDEVDQTILENFVDELAISVIPASE